MIKTWSHSRLVDFETCAHRAYLKYVKKVPEPERPLPPGKTEHANDRGTRVHEECEAFVRGLGPLPKEAEKFRDEFEALATRFAEGKASLEGEWGFRKDWSMCGYYDKDVWLRVKCDAVVILSPKRVLVIDYKTGRKFGNEIKHGEQVILYALAIICRMPELEQVDVELWYLDQDDLTHDAKPAKKWMQQLKLYNVRGTKITSAKEFKPNPSKYACQYCPYKDSECEFAYKETEQRRKGQPWPSTVPGQSKVTTKAQTSSSSTSRSRKSD